MQGNHIYTHKQTITVLMYPSSTPMALRLKREGKWIVIIRDMQETRNMFVCKNSSHVIFSCLITLYELKTEEPRVNISVNIKQLDI